jgi:hypothetical protein
MRAQASTSSEFNIIRIRSDSMRTSSEWSLRGSANGCESAVPLIPRQTNRAATEDSQSLSLVDAEARDQRQFCAQRQAPR